jgi:hypothetical protein
MRGPPTLFVEGERNNRKKKQKRATQKRSGALPKGGFVKKKQHFFMSQPQCVWGGIFAGEGRRVKTYTLLLSLSLSALAVLYVRTCIAFAPQHLSCASIPTERARLIFYRDGGT